MAKAAIKDVAVKQCVPEKDYYGYLDMAIHTNRVAIISQVLKDLGKEFEDV